MNDVERAEGRMSASEIPENSCGRAALDGILAAAMRWLIPRISHRDLGSGFPWHLGTVRNVSRACEVRRFKPGL